MSLKNRIKSFLIFVVIFGFNTVAAAGIDHFEVIFDPLEADVGESLDLTIEAVDKDNNVVTDYDGTILIFSESDPEAELPSALEENTYTFQASDEGVIKFENAVKFKATGIQDIYVYDLNDETVLGVGEVDISKKVVLENIEISIITPEPGLTIGVDEITVSGETIKNHLIKIVANNQSEFETTSNDEGIFEETINDLNDGDNSIKAQVLDADGKVIGESKSVILKVESNLPKLKGIKISESELESESEYTLEVVANSGLTEVSVLINDVITKLEEADEGVYTTKLLAPKESGTFRIDVTLKDELNHEVKEIGAESIVVKEIELQAANEEDDKEQEVEEESEVSEGINKELKISGLKVVELKSKSILTWDEVKEAESYNIYRKDDSGDIEYLDNVTTPKYEVDIKGEEVKYEWFAVKALAKTSSGEIYEGALSDATKVKTGPEMIILLLLSLLVGGMILGFKTKKA